MGNLVDTYVLCPRYTTDDKGLRDNFIDRREEEILELVEDVVDRLVLSEVLKRGYQVIDLFQKTTEMPEEIWGLIEEYQAEYPEWHFARRYREDSMIQRLRKAFFITLLIVENDYDPDKQNRFIIVRSNEVIIVEPHQIYKGTTEEFFSECQTADQSFCNKVITEMKGGDNK